MWQLRFRLFVFLIFVSIAMRCVVCEENSTCDQEYPAGSNRTALSPAEVILKGLMVPKDAIEDVVGKIGGIIGKPKKEIVKMPSHFGDVLNRFADKFRAIFPGTLWCGDGDIAKDDEDLGFFNDTDACCRAHDKCNLNIPAGEAMLNLKNNGIFTRSAYSCDQGFYNCLKEVNSLISKKIQCTYFNLLRPQTFKCLCPKDDCTDNDCKDHCATYEWADNPKAPLSPCCLFP